VLWEKEDHKGQSRVKGPHGKQEIWAKSGKKHAQILRAKDHQCE
jgi:hypothetical protein